MTKTGRRVEVLDISDVDSTHYITFVKNATTTDAQITFRIYDMWLEK